MSKPKPINWIAVRAEYEAGGISLRQLADRLGVNRSTLERRSSKEGWAKNAGKVKAAVQAKVQAKVREKVVEQRVQNALSDLDMINNLLGIAYRESQATEFKSAEGAFASFDRLLKTKLEYSDEHIQKWLLDRGYVAVPIAEFAPSSESAESSGAGEGNEE
jgi:uncharacterized protein YjcR